jgi:hypothetical protein
MWKSLYDPLLEKLTLDWGKYVQANGEQGKFVRESFFNNIYPYSGLILVFFTLFTTLLFYFYLNNRFGKYYKLRSWFFWMFLSSLNIGIFTFFMTRSFLKPFNSPTTLYIVWQSLINLSYGIILFIIFSIGCQLIAITVRKLFQYDLSPMGNRTPF